MGRPKKTHLGTPSVYRDRERVWWAGKWHDLGPAGSAEARAEYGRLAALWSIDPTAPALDPGEYLLVELCADYLASPDSPQAKLQRDRAVLATQLLLELHPVTTVAAFGPKQLRAWQTWLCDLTSKKKPGERRFAVSNVNYNVDMIRRVFKWGVSMDRVTHERWQSLKSVPRPKVGEAKESRVVDPADPEHVKATLPFLRPQPRAMVVLQLASGARPGEVCRMTPGEVHRGGILNVPGAGRHNLDKLDVWAYVPKKHKLMWKKKPRVLMFAGAAKEVLVPFLDRAPDAPCFSPKEAMEAMWAEARAARIARGGRGTRGRKTAKPSRPLGNQYTTAAYLHAVGDACVKAGVPHWFPYQLRHLAAAEIQELFGLDAVQALLGHHTKSQSEHYAGLAVKEAAKVAKARGG